MMSTRISRARASRIDEVGPLWRALHEHHQAGTAHLATVARFRSPDESWDIRREQYLESLSVLPEYRDLGRHRRRAARRE